MGSAIDRLDAHALHQGRDVQPAHSKPFSSQRIAQHASAGERVFQMQFIKPAHQRQIARRCRTWQAIDAAPAEVEHLSLSVD
jgi:hypothetical protein